MDNSKLEKLFLLQTASDIRDCKELAEFYIKHRRTLREYTIINATDCFESIDLYSIFSNASSIKEQVYTPFIDGKVNAVNHSILKRDIITKKGRVYVQPCLSFDTQTISYFYRYYKEQDKSLPSNLELILELLLDEKICVDYIPYAMENLLLSEAKKESVFESIYAFEKLYYRNNVYDDICRKRANEVISSYEKLRFNWNCEPVELYHYVYAVLLKMCCIHLVNNTFSVDEKMKILIEFMNNKLYKLLIPELILAKQYFDKGQAYSFFGKIQRGRTDNIVSIKNMAWDLFHLRMLEMGCAYKNHNKIDASIPYFCTYDKRLFDVKNCYELKSIAINYKTQERIPFYSKTEEVIDYLKDVSTCEGFLNRLERRDLCDVQELIRELEKEMVSI